MLARGYEKGMRMKRHKIRKKRNPGWYFLLPEFLGVSVFGLIPFADVVRRSFCQPWMAVSSGSVTTCR